MACEDSSISLKKRNSSSYISIHASILSIFIAVFVAYSIYQKGVLSNFEKNVISAADKINEIYFIRSVYYPDAGFGDLARNVNKSIKYERTERLQIKIKKEKKVSEINNPKTKDDVRELFRYLHFLVEPFQMEEEEYSIGNNKYIPKDSANRGEEILRIINILGHCYLFPEAPFATDGTFKKGIYNKMYFRNASEVREWLEHLNNFVFESKRFLYLMYLFQDIEYIKALQIRDHELIKRWESHRLLKTYGDIRPEKIYNDFIENIKRVKNIADDAQNQINFYDKLRTNFPSKSTHIIFYILMGFVFVSSVISPMIIPNPPKYFFIHIPVAFYILLYFYGFYKLLY